LTLVKKSSILCSEMKKVNINGFGELPVEALICHLFTLDNTSAQMSSTSMIWKNKRGKTDD